ncbi:MAG: hypothetical protein WC457_02100 [Patescibacteria group bacterium]
MPSSMIRSPAGIMEKYITVFVFWLSCVAVDTKKAVTTTRAKMAIVR